MKRTFDRRYGLRGIFWLYVLGAGIVVSSSQNRGKELDSFIVVVNSSGDNKLEGVL